MNSILRTGLCVTLIIGVFPSVVAAEVMDKEYTLAQIWIVSIAGAACSFALCRWRAWLVFILFPLAFLLPSVVIRELWDPYIGPAIVREAGYGYVIQSYMAALLVIVGHTSGVVLWFRRRSSKRFSSS